MKHRIPTLNEYVNENAFIAIQKDYDKFIQIDHKEKLIESLLSEKSIILNELEKSVLVIIKENNGTNDLFEGTLNENAVYEWCLSINEAGESLAQKWKDKAAAAIETAKEKGKSALSKTQEVLIKIGSDITGLVKVISNTIATFLKKAWAWIYNQTQSKYAPLKDKIIESATPKIHKHGADKTSEEIKNLGAMCKHTIQYFTGDAAKTMTQGITAATKTNESIEYIMEKAVYLSMAELITEGYDVFESDGHGTIHLPLVSSIAKKLTKFPPFTWMHHAEAFVAKNANNAFEKASQMLTKYIGAPGPFEFVFMGTLFGILAGYVLEHGVAGMIEHLGETAIAASIIVLIPGIGWILHTLELVSKGLFLTTIAETAVHTVAAAIKKDKGE